MPTVVPLTYKCSPFAIKMRFFANVHFASLAHYGHNYLSMNNVAKNCAKLENFELKISLCAQLAILSDKNANIKQVSNLLIHYYYGIFQNRDGFGT